MDGVLRAVAIDETRGFVKMLVNAGSDRVLGFAAFGAEAREMMAAIQTAMLAGLPYTMLRDTIFTHPTAAEGFRRTRRLSSLRRGTPSMAITIYYSLPARLLPASTQRFIELNERQGFSLTGADQIQLIRE